MKMHTDAPTSQQSTPPIVSARLLNALRTLRLIAFDFDGVFTDNTVMVDQNGVESVRCWRGDGLGLSVLRDLGLESVVISTEANPVVSARCKKLGIECYQGCNDKFGTLEKIVSAAGCTLAEVAFVGNDVNDAACLRAVGLPIVVADSHHDVISLAAFVTSRKGGHGAVREVCDLIQGSRRALGNDR
jgi:3-deoxy-D-manno-octulosonate 8-phosphate phosphatase (KDO 8-P phosphatase)